MRKVWAGSGPPPSRCAGGELHSQRALCLSSASATGTWLTGLVNKHHQGRISGGASPVSRRSVASQWKAWTSIGSPALFPAEAARPNGRFYMPSPNSGEWCQGDSLLVLTPFFVKIRRAEAAAVARKQQGRGGYRRRKRIGTTAISSSAVPGSGIINETDEPGRLKV